VEDPVHELHISTHKVTSEPLDKHAIERVLRSNRRNRRVAEWRRRQVLDNHGQRRAGATTVPLRLI
jgi:hypothetical protein